MRRIIAAAVLLVCASGACGAQARRAARGGRSLEEALVSYERRSWEAVKRRDFETFGSFIAEDFCDIFPNGKAVSKAELMRDYIRGVDLLDYRLSNFKVVRLSRDAAVVVYEAVARGVEHKLTSREEAPGTPTEIHAAVTSAWARRGGRWLNVFYRESDIK